MRKLYRLLPVILLTGAVALAAALLIGAVSLMPIGS